MSISLRSINTHKEASGYRLIFGYLGIFIIVAGIACLLPLIMLFFHPEEISYAHYFYIPGASSIVVGFLLFLLIFKRDKIQLGKHQDSVLLVLVWLVSMAITSVPFMLRGMSFTDAFFETTSAHSSTGLTVFDFNSDVAPYCYILFRSIITFLGGIGLVLVVTSAISDRYGLRLYTAEGHNDKLMPNLVKSARLILGIYSAYIIGGTLAYWLIGGMQLFDAFNHSVSCLATGGFSTRNGGLHEILTVDYANGVTNELGFFVNPIAIEAITVVLMILGTTNFLLHMFIWSGKIKHYFKDSETKFFFLAWLIFIPLMFLLVYFGNTANYDPLESLHYSYFAFFSAITTTGFTNFPSVVPLGNGAVILMTFLTMIGGGAGSTSGGIKQFRIVTAVKSFYWSTKERFSNRRFVYPHNAYRFGQNIEVTDDSINEAYSYILLYIGASIVLSFAMLIIGNANGVMLNGHSLDFSDCLFEVANAISSAGLTNGLTALANPALNWFLIVAMFIGRLEIYPVYFSIIRVNNDIFRKETL